MKLHPKLEQHLHKHPESFAALPAESLASINHTYFDHQRLQSSAGLSHHATLLIDSQGHPLLINQGDAPPPLLNGNTKNLPQDVTALFSQLARRAQHNKKIIERYYSGSAKIPALTHHSLLIIPVRNNETLFLIAEHNKNIQQAPSLTQRTQQQNNAIIALTKHLESEVTFEEILKKISQCCAETLNIEHAGIWLFNDDFDHIKCEHEYHSSKKQFITPEEIPTSIHKRYFEELANVRFIATDDAINTPGNTPASKAYLEQNNITAMLDAPIKSDGKYLGLMRLYQSGGIRKWKTDEQQFAASLCDIITLAYQKQRKRSAVSKLNESENRFKALAESTGAAIFSFNDTIAYANSATENLTGLDQTSLKILPINVIFGAAFSKAFNRETLKQEPLATGIEIEFSRSSGEIRWAFFNVTQTVLSGEKIWLASAFDITERKRAEIQMRYQAFHDNLTSLPNRAQLTQKIDQCLTKLSKDRYYRFALCQFNIANFKHLNEQLGYITADHLLIDYALKLKRASPATDNLAKIGTSTFIILRENVTSIDHFIKDCEALYQTLKQPTAIESVEIECDIYTGILHGDILYSSSEETLRNIALATDFSEAHGINTISVFNEEMKKNGLKLKEVAAQLRKTLKSNEFSFLYTPYYNFSKNQHSPSSPATTYLEPLIYWQGGDALKISEGHFKAVEKDKNFIKNLILQELSAYQQDACNIPQVSIWLDISHPTIETPEHTEDFLIALQQSNVEPRQKHILQFSARLLNKMLKPEYSQQLDKVINNHYCELAVDITHFNFKDIATLQHLPCRHAKILLTDIHHEIKNNNALAQRHFTALIKSCAELNLNLHIGGIDSAELSLFADNLVSDIISPIFRQGKHLCQPQKINHLYPDYADIKASSSA